MTSQAEELRHMGGVQGPGRNVNAFLQDLWRCLSKASRTTVPQLRMHKKTRKQTINPGSTQRDFATVIRCLQVTSVYC